MNCLKGGSMKPEDKILKISDNKYEINEYIYIIKKVKENFVVFIMDFNNNSFYIEDNYPLELVEKGEKKEISKKDFYLKYGELIEGNIKENFDDIYIKLTAFEVQQSLF
jgi:hypothetical protein